MTSINNIINYLKQNNLDTFDVKIKNEIELNRNIFTYNQNSMEETYIRKVAYELYFNSYANIDLDSIYYVSQDGEYIAKKIQMQAEENIIERLVKLGFNILNKDSRVNISENFHNFINNKSRVHVLTMITIKESENKELLNKIELGQSFKQPLKTKKVSI